ncbi:MAG: hypothetical protein E7035_05130 [Verrucomicrobiaceae bacterium]|nr:hypothetical protein [Verrucomicrobiaceae bacterium]
MKKLITNSIMTLFALSAWALDAINIGTEDTFTTSGGNFDYISFDGNGAFLDQTASYIYLKGTESEQSGNVYVGENVEATFNQTTSDGVYLQSGDTTKTAVGKVVGVSKDTSILNLNVNCFTTQNKAANQQKMEVSNITLNIQAQYDEAAKANYNQSTLRASYFSFNNTKLVVKTPEANSTLYTRLEAGGFSGQRLYQFANSEIIIETGAELRLVTPTNVKGYKSLYLNNTPLTVSGKLNLTNGSVVNDFYIGTGSTITLNEGGVITSPYSLKMDTTTINLHDTWNLTPGIHASIMNNQTTTFNIDAGKKLINSKLMNIGKNSVMLLKGEGSVEINKLSNHYASENVNGENAKLDVQVASATITTLQLWDDKFFKIDVAKDSVLTIGSIVAETEGATVNVSLADDIIKGSILVSDMDDYLKIYNPQEVGMEIGFYTEDGSALRELGVNLWIEETANGSGIYTIYTQVPEPAEWAMIFGAIALGFVAYRRRK